MSETSVVINNVVDKLGNGADRLITDAEKFATEFIRRVDSIAPQIATELKSVGLYAWKCLVRQQLAEGIFYTIAGVMIPVLFYIYFRLFVKPYYNSDGSFDDPWDGFFTFFSILLGLGSIIASGIFLFNGITHLISPEYYAVEELIEKIVELKNPPRNI